MSDSNKKDHWASLASTLGSEDSTEAAADPTVSESVSSDSVENSESIVENSSDVNTVDDSESSTQDTTEVVSEPEVIAEPEAAESAASEPVKKSHWGSIANALGLSKFVEPAEAESTPKKASSSKASSAKPAKAKPAAKKKPVKDKSSKAKPAEIASKSDTTDQISDTSAGKTEEKTEVKSSGFGQGLLEETAASSQDQVAKEIFSEKIVRSESEKTASKIFFGDKGPPPREKKEAKRPKTKGFHDQIFEDEFADEPQDKRTEAPVAEAPIAEGPIEVVETSVEASDTEVSEEKTGRKKRRRRRGGKRRTSSDRSATDSSSEEVSTENASELDTQIEATVEPVSAADKDSASEVQAESTDRPKRRRRRRRPRKAETTETATTETTTTSVSAEEELESTEVNSEFGEEKPRRPRRDQDHDDSESEERHRNIPSWLDAIEVIVDANIERHKTAPKHKEYGGRPRKRRGGSGSRRSSSS